MVGNNGTDGDANGNICWCQGTIGRDGYVGE